MTLKEIADQYGFPFYFTYLRKYSLLTDTNEAIAVSTTQYTNGEINQIIVFTDLDFCTWVGENTTPTFYQPLSDEYLFKEKFVSTINEDAITTQDK